MSFGSFLRNYWLFNLLGIMASVVGILSFLHFDPFKRMPASIGASPSAPRQSRTSVKQEAVSYSVEETKTIYSNLTAQIDGRVYKVIGEDEEIRLQIEDVRDFDKDGVDDALIANILAGGGNACGNTFFFVSYTGNGHFRRTKEFGYSWFSPKIELWNNKWSALITSNNAGINIDDDIEITERYILDSGNAFKVEESRRKEIIAVKEIRSKIFDDVYWDDEARKQLRYDLNSDGVDEVIVCTLWQRWGLLNSKINKVDGTMISENLESCKRIGILETKTNGMHDIVCGFDSVYRWNGTDYIKEEE